MLINRTLSVVAIDIETGVCRKDEGVSEKRNAQLVEQHACRRSHASQENAQSQLNPCEKGTHTIGFVTVRSSITLWTLTGRLIDLLEMTDASVVANEIRAWIARSIACGPFVALMAVASVGCTFVDTRTVVAGRASTCVCTEREREKKMNTRLDQTGLLSRWC